MDIKSSRKGINLFKKIYFTLTLISSTSIFYQSTFPVFFDRFCMCAYIMYNIPVFVEVVIKQFIILILFIYQSALVCETI